MEKLKFEVEIKATPVRVWSVLWDDATYREWTAVFAQGSHAVTDWQTGSKALFLDVRGMGMVSRKANSVAPEFMSLEHLGEVRNGVEDTSSEAVSQWAGAHEDYILVYKDGITSLTLEMDATGGFAQMLAKLQPIALAKVKELAEAS